MGQSSNFLKVKNCRKETRFSKKGIIFVTIFTHFQKQLSNCDRKLVFWGRRESSHSCLLATRLRVV
jgi:hypothetical protein